MKRKNCHQQKNNQYHRNVESAIFWDGNVAGRMNFELFKQSENLRIIFLLINFLYIKLVDDANQRSTLLTRDQHWKVEA